MLKTRVIILLKYRGYEHIIRIKMKLEFHFTSYRDIEFPVYCDMRVMNFLKIWIPVLSGK